MTGPDTKRGMAEKARPFVGAAKLICVKTFFKIIKEGVSLLDI
jgi:hypothetical protein